MSGKSPTQSSMMSPETNILKTSSPLRNRSTSKSRSRSRSNKKSQYQTDNLQTEEDPYVPYKNQFIAPESEMDSSQFGESNLSAKQNGMFNRLKESNIKLSV